MDSGPCALGILLSAIVLQHGAMARFDANLTLKSSFGQLRPRARSLVLCWSEQHSPARIVFERPGGLPRGSQRLLQGSEAHSLILPGTAGLSRTGLFSCRLDAGGIPTTVATLKLPPSTSAQVEPLQAYVVAHVGDTVQLSVTKRVHLDEKLVWRLEGEELIDFEGSETVTLVNVEAADAGIYECHYRGERDAKLHAWIRLVVAGCPRGKFGPTCSQDCPPCRNGGVCHDVYGDCICPAGFAGLHCDTPCGPNRVGADCERVCSPGAPQDAERRGCALHVFCKPDPMSCACAPGFRGAQCNQECDRGFYGADCLQRCHCAMAGDCDSITGRCPQGGCAQGWTGDSCHIEDNNAPTSTKALPTQKPDCPPGWFGKNCSRQCHCENGDACDTSSGHCPGSCQPGYSRPTCSECLAGKFGDNCSLTCHCWNGHQNCMPDGRCHDGCAAGWTGEHCQEGCSNDTFGPDCAYDCHCSAESGRCDPVSGICSACEPGYQGLSCQDKCKAGTYGENCSESCSCLHGETCDHINGSCQCMGRHRGRSCDELVPEVQPAEELELDQGHQGSLLCLIEANPAPHVELSNQENGRSMGNVKVEDLGAGLYKATAPFGKGLETGSHKFHCTATNEHGSDVGTLHVTVLGPPELDSPPKVKVSADSADVSWEPSNSPTKKHGGRGNQIEYQLHLRTKMSSNWTAAGPWQTAVRQSVAPIEPDTEYEFAVQLRRGKLTAWGPPVSARTPCREDSREAVPRNVAAKALSDRRIFIQWERPEPELLGCKLVGFEVHVSARNVQKSVQDLGADAVHTVVDALDADTAYDVTVYAVTSVGRSIYGATTMVKTTQGVPGPVQHLNVAWVNSTEALVVWEAPLGGRAFRHLEYRVAFVARDLGGCGVRGAERVSVTRDLKFHVNGLVPHSLYEVRVSAGSGQGYGKKTDISFLTDAAPPSGVPEKVRVVWAAARSVYLSWEAPPCQDAHGPLLFYRVLVHFAEHHVWFNATGTNLTLRELAPFQRYTLRVKAVNTAGEGPLSAPVTVRTTEDVPGLIKLLAVAAVNQTNARLLWKPPEQPNGKLTAYEVTVSTREVNMAEDNDSLVQALVVDPDIEELLLSNLVAGRSYTASVRATTGVGPGPSTKVHFSTPSQVVASVQRRPYWSLRSLIPWLVSPFAVAFCLLLVNAALVIAVCRRRQYRLDVGSGVACASSTTSTTTDEHELTKHPSQTNSEDGLFVDWSQPNRTFQSTYM